MLQTAPQAMLPPTTTTSRHRIEHETFRHRTIEVEGIEYINCTFIKCRIVFTGFEFAVFHGCTFVRCDWGFAGPAAATLDYLAALYGGLGENGQEMVEGIFEKIRRNLIKSGEPMPPLPEPS